MCRGLGTMGCSFGGEGVVRRVVPVWEIRSSPTAEADCTTYIDEVE